MLNIPTVYLLFGSITFVLYLAYQWNQNRKLDKDETATPPEYSDWGNYKNINPMKEDIMKEASLVILHAVLFSYMTGKEHPIFSTEDFWQSVTGRILLDIIGFVSYFQIIQPLIVNQNFSGFIF